MFCSNCGEKNNNDNKFCFNCGNKLNNEINNKQNSGNKETSLILGIICLVSSLFLNILCFIPGIISIVYANKYKKESGKLGAGFGLSIGGMITSIIILLFIIFIFILIIENIPSINNNYFDYNLPNV